MTANLSKEVKNLDTLKSQLGLFERELNNLQSKKKDLSNELLQLNNRRGKLKWVKDELSKLIQDNDFDPDEEKAATDSKIRVSTTKLLMSLWAMQIINDTLFQVVHNTRNGKSGNHTRILTNKRKIL